MRRGLVSQAAGPNREGGHVNAVAARKSTCNYHTSVCRNRQESGPLTNREDHHEVIGQG